MRRLSRCLALVLALGPCRAQTVSAGSGIAFISLSCSTELEFGKAVTLQVTRNWKHAVVVPERLDFSSWAPLVVTELSSSRVVEGDSTRETLLYRCQAFTRELPALPPLRFGMHFHEGGPQELYTKAPPFRVLPAAQSRPSGPAELPAELFAPPQSWQRPALLAVVAALVAGLLTWQARRRGLLARRATAAPPDPRALARDRLSALRAREPNNPRELRAHYDALAELVREYLAAACGIGAPHATSEELLAASAAASQPAVEPRAVLARVLAACDLVKFAHEEPPAAERARLLDDVERIVSA